MLFCVSHYSVVVIDLYIYMRVCVCAGVSRGHLLSIVIVIIIIVSITTVVAMAVIIIVAMSGPRVVVARDGLWGFLSLAFPQLDHVSAPRMLRLFSLAIVMTMVTIMIIIINIIM